MRLRGGLLAGLVLGCLVAAGVSAAPRETISFDPDWKFKKGEVEGAQAPEFQPAQWETVSAPHDWAIAGPYDENAPSNRGGGYLPSGISWYRKNFNAPQAWSGKKVYIHFEGITANAKVWLNGQLLGERPYAYVPQHYDLTPHLKIGADNVIAIRTDTTKQPASRWYTGQGITRHVRLIVQDPVHIQQFGTFVTTPTITRESATVKVQNTVLNESSAAKDVSVQTVLVGPDGKKTDPATSETKSIPPGGSVTFEQEIKVATPALWDLEKPNLYQAMVSVHSGGQSIDDEKQSFGIRTAEYRAETGFWLNDKNIKILGVCMHHDGGAVGSAVPLRVHERRLEILRSIGVNAIRTAHNPVNPDYLDLCDRMGFLVMEESFDTWTATKPNAEQGYQLHFREWWEKDTTAMVTRDRNHPSLIIWSVGNEIRDNLMAEPGSKYMKDQIDLVHKLDPSRPVTMGLFRPQLAPYLDLLDVVGANYAPQFLVRVRAEKPERKVTVSEDSHGRSSWLAVRNNPAIAGTFVWSGFDYLGETREAGSWPYVVSSSASNGFGIFEHTGYFRSRSYERASWWLKTPMVHASRHLGHAGEGPLVDDWTPADQSTYDKARIQVFTNCEEAEVFLNDTSLGVKKLGADLAPLVYDFDFQPGTLKVVGRNGGQVVATHEMKTADEPTKLAIEADRKTIRNEFDDVSHVIVKLVDDKGVVNPNINELVTWKIEGPGKIIATSTGDRTSHQSFTDLQRKSYHGECMAIVRSTADSGKITITASVQGMPETKIELEAAPGGPTK